MSTFIGIEVIDQTRWTDDKVYVVDSATSHCEVAREFETVEEAYHYIFNKYSKEAGEEGDIIPAEEEC